MKTKFPFILTAILTLMLLPLMAYSTNDDLYERMDEQLVVQLTDDANTGVVNESVLADKRDTCHELVNSYLRGQYTVPMDPAPKLLADVEADLLVDKLYSRRPNMQKPESVKDDYNAAMDTLKAIAKGTIQLEDQPDIQAGDIRTNKKSSDRKFTDSKLDQFNDMP